MKLNDRLHGLLDEQVHVLEEARYIADTMDITP